MAKVSQIDKAIADFERQRDILDRCISALMIQRNTERKPRTPKAAKTEKSNRAITGDIAARYAKTIEAKAKESAS